MSASQLTVRGWGFHFRPTPAEHAEHRTVLEAYAANHPEDPHVWANLAHLYVCEHSLWFNPLPDPLGRAERAARRAIELAPGHQEGWETLALIRFHLHDEPGLLEASDRAIKANPRNANTIAWMGAIFGHKGDYDRGCALVERAMALNAAHPGWYHFTPFDRHFARREFAEALKAARRVNVPDFMWMHFAIAAASGHLGLGAEGAAAAERMVALAPPLSDEGNLREFVSRWYWQPDMIESLLEGVRKARTPPPTSDMVAVPAKRADSGIRSGTAVERPWVAVMPFTAPRGDGDVVSLADGLTDDVSAGLSSFSYLAVVAAASVRRAKDTAGDVRQIGERVGARYLLDGSLRRIGEALRITARLSDARSGVQLWTGTYNRDLGGADLLAVQDDVTDRIVATVGDVHGALLRALTQDFETTSSDRLGPLKLTQRYWAYHRLHSPAEHERMRAAFERLAEDRPTFAFAWSALAHLYWHEHGFLFNTRPEPLERSRRALERALELDPMDQHAWEARALVYFFERDSEGFAHASERAIALNPRNASTLAFMGILVGHAGDVDRSCALAERAMNLNPDHPGWYHIGFANRHLSRGEFADALRAAKRINMPQHLWAHVLVAMAAGELGRQTEAASAVAAIEALAPALSSPGAMRQAFERWKWDAAEADRTMDSYSKAVALSSRSTS